MRPVAILAGGMGTRLHALTATLPKALIDVNGEPFIAHQLRLLQSHGVTHVVICAGHLGHMVESFVGGGARFNLRVDFAFDGPRLLGTAGALRRARDKLGPSFFVLYGDSYLPIDYRAVLTAFEASAALGLMTVYRNDGQFDTSNVDFEHGRILDYDKSHRTGRMCHIDYGLAVLDSRALELVPTTKTYDLASLYRDLLSRNELAGFEVYERFYEVGSVDGLEQTRRLVARKASSVQG
jgi:NDP-sugar pyrophosphorylase family protein